MVGSAGGNNAQIVLQVVRVHTDAVIADRKGTVFRVGLDADEKILSLEAHILICEGLIAKLINSVAGVGNNFPQKDFFMGVDGVNHEVQQPLGFRLKLFLSHGLFVPPVERGFGQDTPPQAPRFFAIIMHGNCEQDMTKL